MYKFAKYLHMPHPQIAKSQPSLKEAFLAVQGAARRMGLRINQAKNKTYDCKLECNTKWNVTIGSYTLEAEQTFTYPGSPVTCKNNISPEIKTWILIANRCCYGLNKILIMPGLTNGSETYVLSTADKNSCYLWKKRFEVHIWPTQRQQWMKN